MLYAVLRLLSVGLLKLFFRLRVRGAEQVPAEGPVLVAANHVSFFDPVAVGGGARRPLHFLAKAELFSVPLFGGLIRRLNAHPVERHGADAGALRLGLALLREGQALLVFPEGTRGEPGTIGAGKPGAGMLAVLSGAPVVPVYVEGTGRALPRGATLPRRARITVSYGPPLRFARERGRRQYQQVSDEIMAAIRRLQAGPDAVSTGDAGRAATTNHADRTARGPLPVGQIH